MKTISFKVPATIIALLLSIQLFSQTKTTSSFTVSGNCESCKKRIEAAANKVKGVESALWEADKQQVTIVYDGAKTKPEDVGTAIAKAGYDNQYAKAEDNAYKKLPTCCKYDRKKE